MKTSARWSSLFAAAMLTALAPFATADDTPANPADTLHITIDYFDSIRFERMRYARANGDELILSTLKANSAREADFAGFEGTVIVLDEGVPPPAGAPVLRLTWTDGAVTADYNNGVDRKPKYLGVVSRTEIAFHPDHKTMLSDIHRAGLSDDIRDARLRAYTRMNLYIGLQRVVRETEKTRT